MGTCLICGTPVDGRICDSHQEDVVFDFRGDNADQLTDGRFYTGVVDGYADFGVFVDLAPGVTGLLHRSELDRRLESLDWEPGDTVFVQVKNVRDNGNIDLGWSIRQSEREFRGALVQDADGDHDPDGEDESDDEAGVDAEAEAGAGADATAGGPETTDDGADATADAAGDGGRTTEVVGNESRAGAETETESEVGGSVESVSGSGPDSDTGSGSSPESAADRDDAETEAEPEDDRERVEIGTLSDRVGSEVRIEGEVVGARQTGGPTVFEVRDETGVVDCAAFVEAGVRAYPDIEVGDMVRLDGEIELRRGEIQVETSALVELEGEEGDAVSKRLSDALTDRARPEGLMPLADHDSVSAVSEPLLDAAEAIRRAVLESRPIVVRHAATADGYVAGAAVERAVLPLVREEYAKSDAEYHYFTRRPLDDVVYGMDAATNDVTRMLQDRDRHDEKLPLVLLLGTGSTSESRDGLGLLGVYGVKRVVVDAVTADEDVSEDCETLVSPDGADDLSTGALAANLAAAVNGEVRDELSHLPAVSYWEGAPEAYTDIAADAGFDAERVREIREAVALEAYYQSYEDKRELIADLLWADPDAEDGEESEGGLAAHVSEQFRVKLDDEVETAQANVADEEREGVTFSVLDADAFTHRFDFPPTTLLLDELHRRNREGERFVTVGLGMDELFLRSTGDLDVRAVADAAREAAPEAGIAASGVRQNRIEFLSGARDEVEEAVLDAVAAQFE